MSVTVLKILTKVWKYRHMKFTINRVLFLISFVQLKQITCLQLLSGLYFIICLLKLSI